jgi:hypothetical protein
VSFKVLSYGKKRCVILEALAHDKDCVLANILAAHFLYSSDPSRASSCLEAAKSQLVIFHLLLLYMFTPKKIYFYFFVKYVINLRIF